MTTAVAALARGCGGSVALENVAVGAPGPGEILVRVMASGVCPTDLHALGGGAGVPFPVVLGHEGAGVVEEVGPGVDLSPGDHVVLSFDSCGSCRRCAEGHPAYCERFAALNNAARTDLTVDGDAVATGWMAQSSWSTHAVVRASCAVRISDDVPWAVAATLGCGVLTGAGTVLTVLRPGPGDALLVIGAGTTGLAAVMAAAHRGVRRIVVSDPLPSRRELALTLGATEARSPADLLRSAATHVVDTVGTAGTTEAALAALQPHGTAATIALRPGANPVPVSQSRLLWGRGIRGVIEGDADVSRDIPTLVALWRAGRLPVEHLVTTYPFADIDLAIADLAAGRTVKPVLLLSDDAAVPARPSPRALADLPEEDLPALWRSLPPVAPAELTGLWRGVGLSPGHGAHRLLTRTGWHGKLFRSADDVAPLVCADADGRLFVDERTARGAARLLVAEHDGIRTTAMVYDGQPIVDFFTRLDADTLLGVMTGRHAAGADGRLYHFVLHRDADRAVADGVDPAASAVTFKEE